MNSPKQQAVLDYLREHESITLTQACFVGEDIFANRKKHVGALLANMVKRRMLERIKPGVFAIPKAKRDALKGIATEQETLELES